MRSSTVQRHEDQISNFYFLISTFCERLQTFYEKGEYVMIKFKIIEITVLCFLAISVNAQAGNLKIPERLPSWRKLIKDGQTA